MKPLQTPSTDARARRIFGLSHLPLLLIAVLPLALGLAGPRDRANPVLHRRVVRSGIEAGERKVARRDDASALQL